MIRNARLCKTLIDHITDRANIIETGTESYRQGGEALPGQDPEWLEGLGTA